MTDHDIDRRRADDLDQSGGVPLTRRDARGEPGVGRAALERSQRVRAWVDHSHAVTQGGQFGGEHPGAAAHVDDVQDLAGSLPGGELRAYQL